MIANMLQASPGFTIALEPPTSLDPCGVKNCSELFRFRFGIDRDEPSPSGVFSIPLRTIGDEYRDEVWYTSGSVFRSIQDGVSIAECPDYLAVHLQHDNPSDDPLSHIAEKLYRELIVLARNRGYPHMLRAWNYFPKINEGFGDDERYKQFTIGRSSAFESFGFKNHQLPAGTAIGSTEKKSPITITLLSTKHPCRMVENPRQVSAYDYPRRYGKRAPSFSRAAMLESEGRNQLFVSGTASVIGHESCHADNLADQCHEACLNVDTLVKHAAKTSGLQRDVNLNQNSCFRVYLRQPGGVDVVREKLAEWLGPQSQAVFLQADICRPELTIEIESNHWI